MTANLKQFYVQSPSRPRRRHHSSCPYTWSSNTDCSMLSQIMVQKGHTRWLCSCCSSSFWVIPGNLSWQWRHSSAGWGQKWRRVVTGGNGIRRGLCFKPALKINGGQLSGSCEQRSRGMFSSAWFGDVFVSSAFTVSPKIRLQLCTRRDAGSAFTLLFCLFSLQSNYVWTQLHRHMAAGNVWLRSLQKKHSDLFNSFKIFKLFYLLFFVFSSCSATFGYPTDTLRFS